MLIYGILQVKKIAKERIAAEETLIKDMRKYL